MAAPTMHLQGQSSHQPPTGMLPICFCPRQVHVIGVPLWRGSPPIFPCRLPLFTCSWPHWGWISWRGFPSDCSIPAALLIDSFPDSPARRVSSSVPGVLVEWRMSPVPLDISTMKAAAGFPDATGRVAGCIPATGRIPGIALWSPCIRESIQLFPRHSSSGVNGWACFWCPWLVFLVAPASGILLVWCPSVPGQLVVCFWLSQGWPSWVKHGHPYLSRQMNQACACYIYL